MNIRIGITQSPRELEIDLGDEAEAEKVIATITDAVAADTGMLWLTDRKGKRVGFVTSKVAYVEVGPESETNSVGFKA